MTQEEIKENNILLANFLKWRIHEDYNYITPFYQSYDSIGNGCYETPIFRFEDLKFHKSWDWLMLVISKILEICAENDDLDSYSEIVDQIPQIDHTYKAVVQFIENNNKN
jgi:hypothetical protein